MRLDLDRRFQELRRGTMVHVTLPFEWVVTSPWNFLKAVLTVSAHQSQAAPAETTSRDRGRERGGISPHLRGASGLPSHVLFFFVLPTLSLMPSALLPGTVLCKLVQPQPWTARAEPEQPATTRDWDAFLRPHHRHVHRCALATRQPSRVKHFQRFGNPPM